MVVFAVHWFRLILEQALIRTEKIYRERFRKSRRRYSHLTRIIMVVLVDLCNNNQANSFDYLFTILSQLYVGQYAYHGQNYEAMHSPLFD